MFNCGIASLVTCCNGHLTMQYRNDIDGLRAIAVLAVVLFHSKLAFPGGFVGVDVFFVISGYLITSLILADLGRGTFSLSRFWERRIRRIWPASLVTVLVTLCLGSTFMFPEDLRGLANDAIAQVFMLANVRFWHKTDYFADFADLNPLLHMWSLALEEQFYVFFPLLLAWCWRCSRSRCWIALAVVAALSFVASWALLDDQPAAVFYLLPFRVWELLVGALLAFCPWVPTKPWQRECLGVLGMLMILRPCLCYDRSTPFPGVAAVEPCLGAATLILVGSGGGSLVGRVLQSPPLMLLGKMSYSIYLWHWPLIVFLRYGLTPRLPGSVVAVYIAILLAVSYASWRWIELPLRAASSPLQRTRVLAGVAIASLAVLVSAGLISLLRGVPSRFTGATLRHLATESTCVKWESMASADFATRSIGAIGGERPVCFLLWGDSHGMAISPVVDTVARQLSVKGEAALVRGHLPAIVQVDDEGVRMDFLRLWNEKAMAWIERCRPRHLILCGRWSNFFDPMADRHDAAGEDPYTEESRGRWPRRRMLLWDNLDRLAAQCDRLNMDVWLLMEVPYNHKSVRERVRTACFSGREPSVEGISRSEHERRVQPVREVFKDIQGRRVHIIDLAEPFFGGRDTAIVRSEGCWWYSDDDHLGPTGARLALGDIIREVMETVASDCGPK